METLLPLLESGRLYVAVVGSVVEAVVTVVVGCTIEVGRGSVVVVVAVAGGGCGGVSWIYWGLRMSQE